MARSACWHRTAGAPRASSPPWSQFKRLTEGEIASYLAGGEWQGKAGGYAIQGMAAAFVPAINGSYPNVVGLPVVETLALLAGLGWRMPR